MERRSARSSKYRPTPSSPVKVRPRNGANEGCPCSWTAGSGFVVKWERSLEVEEPLEKAVQRDWAGSRRDALV